ncbi:hypothetical protein NDU88_007605 [Pleurodeles waltl]|uniref:Uncharacterized protein n=1 Tax=Pleurodeles waltl TaxID=8319 RepID=A0AAV7QLA6_PLEWA|nr:hypothetical protein NDU88_007605 [Pleurodeles waltl]
MGDCLFFFNLNSHSLVVVAPQTVNESNEAMQAIQAAAECGAAPRSHNVQQSTGDFEGGSESSVKDLLEIILMEIIELKGTQPQEIAALHKCLVKIEEGVAQVLG